MVASLRTDEHAGRQERAEELFRAHAPAVLAYAMRRGVRPADAEDIVAETFLVCWRRLDVVPDSAVPWLLGVARRVSANHLRAERRRLALRNKVLQAAAQESRLTSGHDSTYAGSALAACQRLRLNERQLWELVALEDLTYEEAGRRMGCSPEAFRSRLRRSRARLQALMLCR